MAAPLHLFEGLTVRRVLWVTLICAIAAGTVVRFFLNRYLDLLVTALCVGYTSMLLYTVASNLRTSRVPREVLQLLAIVAGSVLGTIFAGIVKGRDIPSMFSERLAGVAISMGLGLGFGCVVVATVILREKHARDAARIARAEAERHQLEKNVLEARLQLMQAQVEPHFLFNTLANVRRLHGTDPTAARNMLEHLTRYLKAALPQMRDGRSTLGRDAEIAMAYLRIQQVRMGRRLVVAIDIPAELHELPVPAMMLLTLAENAIKHGVGPALHGGTVRLGAHAEGDRLTLTVADSGVGLAPGSGTGIGLANIRARLAAQFGRAAQLALQNNELGGLTATIALPLATAQQPA